jgi:hypothetical protein
MFMTPSEIHAGYQPLDADREEHGRDTYIPRGSDRSTFTGGSGYRRTTGGSYAGYTHYGSKYKTVEETESDEALYARKLDEAQGYGDEDSYEPKMVGGRSSRWSGETYHPRETGSIHRHTGPAPEGKSRLFAEKLGEGSQAAHWTQGASKSSWESPQRYTPSEPGMTLHESIGESGVQSPIRLGTAGAKGSMGKPQIVGGHHRLASATEHATYGKPGEYGSSWGHQFLPVLHYTDIGAAKSDQSFKYT